MLGPLSCQCLPNFNDKDVYEEWKFFFLTGIIETSKEADEFEVIDTGIFEIGDGDQIGFL